MHAHLVGHIAADVLEPALAALARHARRVVAHGELLVRRLRGEVDAVHGARARLDERQRHLEPEPAPAAGDERDAVRERELVCEERGSGRGV